VLACKCSYMSACVQAWMRVSVWAFTCAGVQDFVNGIVRPSFGAFGAGQRASVLQFVKISVRA
jgi:hypothetical protein